MTNPKKWFDKKYGEGSYATLEMLLESEIKIFHADFPYEDSGEDDSEPCLDVRLRDFDGGWSLLTGDSQYDTDHRGRWAYAEIPSSPEWEHNAAGIAEELVGELREEFSDLEEWANIDIPATEEAIGIQPYVIFIRTGQSIPSLEVVSLEEWNKENAIYVDAEEEDTRCRPRFYEGSTTSLERAIRGYRNYLSDEGLRYLLEDGDD